MIGKKKGPDAYDVVLPIHVTHLVGDSWFGITKIAGVTIRGPRRDGPLSAAQALLGTFVDGSLSGGAAYDQSVTALELALAGVSIDEIKMPELSDGV